MEARLGANEEPSKEVIGMVKSLAWVPVKEMVVGMRVLPEEVDVTITMVSEGSVGVAVGRWSPGKRARVEVEADIVVCQTVGWMSVWGALWEWHTYFAVC